jgi:uncharacterized protein (TIGR00290 family)
MSNKTVYFNWSSGKDSALALYHLLEDRNYSVDYLVTSMSTQYNRVSMHGLRRELLQEQLNSIGIEYGTVEFPDFPSNDIYEQVMGGKVQELKSKGFEYAAFGDIFLEDLKQYRESKLALLGIKALFPIWQKDTTELINEFLDLGFKAVVLCINGDLLDESLLGRTIDRDFINDLPEGVDPCGENGEFHTFCYDGPIFSHPIQFSSGETVVPGICSGICFRDDPKRPQFNYQVL